jgi:enoyl-CoA hydratase
MSTPFNTLKYQKESRLAFITLNRPERLNAINNEMPVEIQRAVEEANLDDDVHVIILSGEGRAFCSGYDMKYYAEQKGPVVGSQKMPWDPLIDYQMMSRNTSCFMSLWRSLKPVICKIHGYAIAGGSDIALCCDLIVMDENAKIGYPPARIWGCPTTFMWVYRLGIEQAKRLLLTGDLITGKEAKEIGLVTEAVPLAKLDETVMNLANRMASIPKNQLMMHKLVVNKAYENLGLSTIQTLATFFDGVARHTPEGLAFKKRVEEVGFQQAVKERDSGIHIYSKL